MKRALMAVAAAMLAAAAGAQDRVAVMLRTNDWALVGHGTNLTAATIGAATAAQGAKADGALASTNAVGRAEWTGSSLDITMFGPGTGAGGDLQWIPGAGLYEYDASYYQFRKVAREDVSLWPWASITNAPTIPSVGSVSPREGWRVWTDATNVFAVHGSGAGAVTNASFSWVMNHCLTNASQWNTVISLGNEASVGTVMRFYVDGPVRINSGVTIRGQGTFGTLVSPTNGYTGRMWIAGDSTTIGGSVTFQSILFDDLQHVNTNAVIEYARCTMVRVHDCQFSGMVGPAIRIAATNNYVYQSSIARCWFVGTESMQPMVEIDATGTNWIGNCLISDSLFYQMTGQCARVSGDAHNVAVHGCWTYHRVPTQDTSTGFVFRGGSGHIVSDCAFYNWSKATTPILFDADASNDFASVASGNTFNDYTTGYGFAVTNTASTNAVLVAANAHGVRVIGNAYGSGGPRFLGANAGGFNELGSIAASNSSSYVKSSGGNATNVTASGTFTGNGAGLTNISLFAGAVNMTTTTLASNGIMYAYAAPTVGTNRTLAGCWLQIAITTNTAALGGFGDVTNLALEVYGSYSVGGSYNGSTAVLPVPAGGSWQTTAFAGYHSYTVEIPTNITLTSASGSGLMPTYLRFGLRYRGQVSVTSATFVVAAKVLP